MNNTETTERLTESINPATGEVIGYTRENTVEELYEAVRLAKVVQKSWQKKSYNERKEHLLRIRDYIVSNAERISEVISKNNCKTRIDALSTEVVPAALAANYYAKQAGKLLQDKKIKAGNILFINKRSYIHRVPFGVIGIISPWNYPFGIPFHEIMMALITGNAVILKVATQSLEVGKILEEVISAGELPENLFRLINIPGKIAGEAFINSGINKLFFTGSVEVGKYLMKLASEKLIPVSLELGGNDAMIVCKDANLYRAAMGALWAGFSNAGQSCAGVERIYVEEPVYDEFISILKEKTLKLKVGADKNFNVEIGAITTPKQLSTIKTHVEDAVRKGAIISAQSDFSEANPKGLFHKSIILENVNDSMFTMQKETFGPVLAVEKVKDLDEAIEKANKSDLGLTASIWTKNKKLAHQAAKKIEAGTVTINDHLMSHGLAETPWGGFKNSGIGRTHGLFGLEETTQPICIVDDILPGVQKNMWWYPHGKKVYDGLLGAINFLYVGGIKKRIAGGYKMFSLFLRTFRRE